MNRTRLAVLTSAAVGTVLLASGCAAGTNAATLQVQPNLVSGQSDSILAQNIVVVVDPETGAAQLTGTVINTDTAPNSADTLTGIRVGSTSVALPQAVTVSPGGSVNLASDSGPKFVIPKGSGLKPGINSDVALTFQTAGSIQMSAQVAANTGIYAAYQPSIGEGQNKPGSS